MSTFDGIVQEFPYIQIDYFRKNPERPPPLACFLSHVHSDHLQGLESFRAPFIYCSAATRELLLRIEKYPHRMNFSKGILESRRLHYKHLTKLLRPIPLDTPTQIELTPLLSIRVTLLDANHCAGAVMFLIEGDGKAVLYTGDIRAERWWVDSLVRHPVLIPYTLGSKKLDKMYLDTTFARVNRVCRSFPSKAEGLRELLQKVEAYPKGTIFYFRAWTFGYEDVWIALSALLNTKVHVDRYQIGLYRSLISNSRRAISEAPALCGFELGNRFVPGCLSEDESSRVHSCEPGVHCSAVRSKRTVYIMPIVGRMEDGTRVPEIGAGGGGGDLYQTHVLELPDQSSLEQLESLCLEQIGDPETLSQTRKALTEAFRSKNKALSLDSYGMKDVSDIPLQELVQILGRGRSDKEMWSDDVKGSALRDTSGNRLPKTIYFPYSRHSSYEELCELVSAFKPRDVYPCTVDALEWNEDVSMRSLFGHLCSGHEFVHDQYMRDTIANDEELRSRKRVRYDDDRSTQSTQQSISMDASIDRSPTVMPNTSEPQVQPHTSRTSPITSLETVPDATINLIPKKTSPQPLPIPKSSPEAAKAKRNEIRRAWHFLHAEGPRHPEIDLGALPSSWPTAEEDGFHLHPGESSETGDETRTPTQDNLQSDHNHNLNDDDDNEDDNDNHMPNSQVTNTLSISSSAFASQDQTLGPLQQDGPGDVDIPPSSEGAPGQPRTLDRSSSSRARRAAYLAARADSYDAWACMGLVSAGDNHSMEETEL
ncbi:putative DNA repair protein [Aspergillus novofumigatus IBT 16806]|uniref:Protein artemis n=1 Tax=Aspergillus novofumigatus (strain IBT 16806) TaxID=1392255 RepID=A0A2I1BVU0_ASPN1|nr:putative DNA repair protein [Aspergillus novofumigatus IBT 16806]PKX89504.1 putative DNA repair protein [Aspergillus novofumigatus IBT 16806]